MLSGEAEKSDGSSQLSCKQESSTTTAATQNWLTRLTGPFDAVTEHCSDAAVIGSNSCGQLNSLLDELLLGELASRVKIPLFMWGGSRSPIPIAHMQRSAGSLTQFNLWPLWEVSEVHCCSELALCILGWLLGRTPQLF